VALVKPIVVSGPFVAKLWRLRAVAKSYRFVRGSSISNQGRCETPAPIGNRIPNKHAAAIAPADLQLAVRFSQSEGIEHRRPSPGLRFVPMTQIAAGSSTRVGFTS